MQLDRTKIKNYFIQLAGLDASEFSQQPIIENAAEYIEQRIIAEDMDVQQKSRCEYAAAVCAVYDYVLGRDLTERIVVTRDGRAVGDFSDEGTVSAAYKLKQSVLGSVKDLIGGDFSFSAVKGG